MQFHLSDTHRVILASAAARDDLRALALPITIRSEAAHVTEVIGQLKSAGLLTADATVREDHLLGSHPRAHDNFKITDAGLRAIGVEIAEGRNPNIGAMVTNVGEAPPGPKLQLLVILMSRDQGATLEQLVSATGWQKHSVRAAISGQLKKRYGHSILCSPVAGRGRVYRIEPKTSACSINEDRVLTVDAEVSR